MSAKRRFLTNAPKKVTYIISLVLGVLGVLGSIISIPFVSAYAIWFIGIAWLLLALGCYVKGL